MINWEIELMNDAPEKFKSDKFKSETKEIVNICVKYIYNKIADFHFDASSSLEFLKFINDIVNKLPILYGLSTINNQREIKNWMQSTNKESFMLIRYNRFVYIRTTYTIGQILRDYRLNKILENE